MLRTCLKSFNKIATPANKQLCLLFSSVRSQICRVTKTLDCGTHLCLVNYRRLWKNCERTLENSRQSCLLAGVAILLKDFKQVLSMNVNILLFLCTYTTV